MSTKPQRPVKDFAERLKYLIDYFDAPPDIPEKRLEKLVTGTQPNLDEIAKVKEAYPSVSTQWLVQGVGVVFIETPDLNVTNYNAINTRFRDARIEHQYTQQEWGNLFGKARSTVASIEINRHSISFADVIIMNRKFGYTFKWILTGEGPKRESQSDDLLSELERCHEQNRALQAAIHALSK